MGLTDTFASQPTYVNWNKVTQQVLTTVVKGNGLERGGLNSPPTGLPILASSSLILLALTNLFSCFLRPRERNPDASFHSKRKVKHDNTNWIWQIGLGTQRISYPGPLRWMSLSTNRKTARGTGRKVMEELRAGWYEVFVKSERGWDVVVVPVIVFLSSCQSTKSQQDCLFTRFLYFVRWCYTSWGLRWVFAVVVEKV